MGAVQDYSGLFNISERAQTLQRLFIDRDGALVELAEHESLGLLSLHLLPKTAAQFLRHLGSGYCEIALLTRVGGEMVQLGRVAAKEVGRQLPRVVGWET